MPKASIFRRNKTKQNKAKQKPQKTKGKDEQLLFLSLMRSSWLRPGPPEGHSSIIKPIAIPNFLAGTTSNSGFLLHYFTYSHFPCSLIPANSVLCNANVLLILHLMPSVTQPMSKGTQSCSEGVSCEPVSLCTTRNLNAFYAARKKKSW